MKLSELAELNGIYVPSIFDYKLMSEAKKITQEEINKIKKDASLETLEELISLEYVFDRKKSFWSCHGDKYDWYRKRYVTEDNEIMFERIPGKHRKVLKTEIKNYLKLIQKNVDIFNSFVGKDVLLINAKLGSYSWSNKKHNSLITEPWYIASVDSWWDRAYANIYAKITKVG